MYTDVIFDLGKAYDKIPSDLIWWSLGKKGIPDQYFVIIQEMYISGKSDESENTLIFVKLL